MEGKEKEEVVVVKLLSRAPDAFANVFLLFAGWTVAVGYSLKNYKEALGIAENLHIGEVVAEEKGLKFCRVLAVNLRGICRDRRFYEVWCFSEEGY